MMSILSNLEQLDQSKTINKMFLKGDFNARLRRYKMWQERIDEIDERVAQIKKNCQVGEEPEIFYQLLEIALKIQEKHIMHVWHQVKRVILPNSQLRNLLIETNWLRGDLPPNFKEIELILDKYALELTFTKVKSIKGVE